MRYRPSVSITVAGLPSLPQLRLKNQGPFDVIIEDIEISMPAYRILAAQTVRGAVFAAVGKPPGVLLGPGEERLLALIDPPGMEPEIAAKDDRSVSITVRWTRGDHPFLRPCSRFGFGPPPGTSTTSGRCGHVGTRAKDKGVKSP